MINTERLFKGRLNRRDFTVGLVIFSFLRLVAALPGFLTFFVRYPYGSWTEANQQAMAQAMAKSFSVYSPEGIISTLLILALTLWSLGIYARRFHDVGMPTKYAGFVLVDYLVGVIFSNANAVGITAGSIISQIVSFIAGAIVLYLVFRKSKPETNEYGPVSPAKRSIKEIMFGEEARSETSLN